MSMTPEHAPMNEFPVDARGELTVGGTAQVGS